MGRNAMFFKVRNELNKRFFITFNCTMYLFLQAGSVSCEKRACPVLNCPKESIYSLPGDCCPRCKGNVVPTKSDSDEIFCQQLFSKTIKLHLS